MFSGKSGGQLLLHFENATCYTNITGELTDPFGGYVAMILCGVWYSTHTHSDYAQRNHVYLKRSPSVHAPPLSSLALDGFLTRFEVQSRRR